MSKTKNILELLFGSRAEVKILKFLFRNPDLAFDVRTLAARVQERPLVVRKEIKNLISVGLIKIKR